MLCVGAAGGGNDFVNGERSRAAAKLLGAQGEGQQEEEAFSGNMHVLIFANSPLTPLRLLMSHLGTPWPKIIALYRQALPLPEADRIAFLQQQCGERTPLFYEVRSLLAGTEPRIWIEN